MCIKQPLHWKMAVLCVKRQLVQRETFTFWYLPAYRYRYKISNLTFLLYRMIFLPLDDCSADRISLCRPTSRRVPSFDMLDDRRVVQWICCFTWMLKIAIFLCWIRYICKAYLGIFSYNVHLCRYMNFDTMKKHPNPSKSDCLFHIIACSILLNTEITRYSLQTFWH